MSIVILSEAETLAKQMARAVEGPRACWRKDRPRKEFLPGAHAVFVAHKSSISGAGCPPFSRSWPEGGDLTPEPPSPRTRAHVERTPPSAALCRSRKRPQPKSATAHGGSAAHRHVILSEVTASRSEAVTQSKDPYGVASSCTASGNSHG